MELWLFENINIKGKKEGGVRGTYGAHMLRRVVQMISSFLLHSRVSVFGRYCLENDSEKGTESLATLGLL